MTNPLVINVIGTPAPQGSFSASVRNGRAFLFQDNRATKPWREAVTKQARAAMDLAGAATIDGPCIVRLRFFLPRPKSVSRRRVWPCVRPDADKLARAALDALVDARVLVDDALVVKLTASKHYARANPGARIVIRPLGAGFAPGKAAS